LKLKQVCQVTQRFAQRFAYNDTVVTPLILKDLLNIYTFFTTRDIRLKTKTRLIISLIARKDYFY